jgi:hypothetical protein
MNLYSRASEMALLGRAEPWRCDQRRRPAKPSTCREIQRVSVTKSEREPLLYELI